MKTQKPHGMTAQEWFKVNFDAMKALEDVMETMGEAEPNGRQAQREHTARVNAVHAIRNHYVGVCASMLEGPGGQAPLCLCGRTQAQHDQPDCTCAAFHPQAGAGDSRDVETVYVREPDADSGPIVNKPGWYCRATENSPWIGPFTTQASALEHAHGSLA